MAAVAQWDAQGNPLPAPSAPPATPPAAPGASTQWDADGNPISSAPPATPPTPPAAPAEPSALATYAGQDVDMAKGLVKGGMDTVGGLLTLLNRSGSHANPSAADAYRQAHPEATPEQAIDATTTAPDPQGHIHAVQAAADWLKQHAQSSNLAQSIGKLGEGVGEFLIPGLQEDAAAKAGVEAPTYAEKASEAAKAAQFLEKTPIGQKLSGLASIGLRALRGAVEGGAGAGAQTYVKTGGDTNAAVQAGAAGAAGGAAIGAVAEGGGQFIAKRAAAAEKIAGEDVPALSSQQPGKGPRGDVTAGEVPKFAAKQQAAAPKVFRNIAQRATKNALDDANRGRVPAGLITDPARMLPAPADAKPYAFTIEGPGATSEETPAGAEPRKKQIGTQYVAGKGSGTAPKTEAYDAGTFQHGDQAALPPVSDAEPFGAPGHKEPVFQYLTQLKPGQTAGGTSVTGGGDLVSAGPEEAQMHLSRLNELVDNPPAGTSPQQVQAITDARDSLQDQMDMYNAHQRTMPNFAPIDSARAAANVGHFGEAEDQLQQAAKPIYQKIDAATDGQFGKLNKMRGAAAKRGDFTAKYDYEDQIDKLIEDSGAITPAEKAQATKLWSTSKVLGGFNDVIDRAANVNDRYASQVAGGRSISGTKLQNGLQSLITRYGTSRLESVVGQDGMENMTRMADLLKTQPQSKIQGLSLNIYHNLVHGKVGAAIGIGIGHHLGGYEGALAGSIAGSQAERAILRYVATNPRVGQLFDYAVRNDVTPKVATGLIAAEIQRERDEQKQEGGTQ